MIMLDCRLLHS